MPRVPSKRADKAQTTEKPLSERILFEPYATWFKCPANSFQGNGWGLVVHGSSAAPRNGGMTLQLRKIA
jgi:hypothetical protein